MPTRPHAIIMLGPPGSGKDTQAAKLGQKFGLVIFATGDLFRQAMAEGSELGQKIAAPMQMGGLVPADLTRQVVEKAIVRQKETIKERGIILNSYPRSADQLKDAEEIFAKYDLEPVLAVFLDVPDEELTKRLLARGRVDDTPELIKRRIEVYRAETAPVVEHFQQKSKLLTIDGNHPIEEVARDLVARLSAHDRKNGQ